MREEFFCGSPARSNRGKMGQKISSARPYLLLPETNYNKRAEVRLRSIRSIRSREILPKPVFTSQGIGVINSPVRRSTRRAYLIS